MAKKGQSSKKVKVELSVNEASYLQGMLAAYKQRLEIDKSSGSSLIAQEIRKARRLEKKFVSA